MTGPGSPARIGIARADGVVLAVKVTPKSARAAVIGCAVDAAGAAWLAVTVTAAPEGGRANDAVLALLAKQLAMPRSRCRVIAGATSRWKRVLVAGDPVEIGGRLAALLATDT